MDLTKFRELLESEHDWPTEYHFKFLLESDSTHHVLELFKQKEYTLQTRVSSQGKYTGLTIKSLMSSPDEVVEIYLVAKNIKGIISL